MMKIVENSVAVHLTESLPLTYQALHLAKSMPVTDTLSKMQDLSVTLSEILDRLVEQYCRLKKVVFSLKIKKAEQSQSQIDRLRLAFRLIQERKETFAQPLPARHN